MDRSSHALGAETSKFITVRITNHGQGINSSNSIFFFSSRDLDEIELPNILLTQSLPWQCSVTRLGAVSTGFANPGRQVWRFSKEPVLQRCPAKADWLLSQPGSRQCQGWTSLLPHTGLQVAAGRLAGPGPPL